jgi:hypothetical protein
VTDDIRYLCIRCWRIIERSNALVVCAQCEGPSGVPWLPAGSTITRQRLRDLRPRFSLGNLFADGDRELECPDHQGSPLQLACECGQLLSRRAAFAGVEPVGLGFAGPFSAGKTLLITTMVEALQGLALAPGAEVGLLGIDDTDTRFATLTEALNQGVKLKQTVPEEREEHQRQDKVDSVPRNFCWEVFLGSQDASLRGSLGLLPVYDLAGETWMERPLGPLDLEGRLETFLRYLRLLRSLVFVLDGAVLARDLRIPVEDAWAEKFEDKGRSGADAQLLGVIMERLGERCAGIDLALTVSKMDLLWEQEQWSGLAPGRYEQLEEQERRRLVEDLLAKSKRSRLLTAARERFRSVEVFATSSLGFRPTPDLVIDDRLTRPPEPVGVKEPLRWLLGQWQRP